MDIFNFFRSSGKKTKDIAKDRLKLVLIHDRGDFPQEKKEAMKRDLVEVLSRYVEIDADNLEITILTKKDTENGNTPQINANAPIKKIF